MPPLRALRPEDLRAPAPVPTGPTRMYASDEALPAPSGDLPDPADIRAEQVRTTPRRRTGRAGRRGAARPWRTAARGAAPPWPGIPDPAAPDPWIGPLLVEARMRESGRRGARLAVLDGDTAGPAFWKALGYEEFDRRRNHRRDRRLARGCAMLLRKSLEPS